jgi:hypothetical protein
LPKQRPANDWSFFELKYKPDVSQNFVIMFLALLLTASCQLKLTAHGLFAMLAPLLKEAKNFRCCEAERWLRCSSSMEKNKSNMSD